MTDTTYSELLGTIDEFAGRLDPQEQAACLYGLIAPLLDRVEQEDEEFSDEPVLSTPEAVEGLRRAAAEELIDADAVYDHLTAVGLYYSEDQDEERHVIAQTADAGAAWLRLLTGRELRSTSLEDDEDLIPSFAPSTFTQIVDLLAWTRSGQVYIHWEDAIADPGLCDLPAAIHELRAMHLEITT
ncbi:MULTISPECIES: hypothetical protein [unclassified Streptomyces]|uniref:hypothetical protein n=1 Tax=unclassified Streptomyces TaxID=2593676 RepID=UPI002DDC6DB5|nr:MULTISPECIES: hypothetical protein [unclassified Streptomyces]WSB77690.1 hypothetical protein OHB04_19160 [Streptomyces sp. NBC_01775]WSS14060.1 hypothetical protein OG533_20885 [Streptomyces sp. NBC_01186]WSS42880.1 hypothetical protein OG220_21590 [Streptomyces sp. NBC_01187]